MRSSSTNLPVVDVINAISVSGRAEARKDFGATGPGLFWRRFLDCRTGEISVCHHAVVPEQEPILT